MTVIINIVSPVTIPPSRPVISDIKHPRPNKIMNTMFIIFITSGVTNLSMKKKSPQKLFFAIVSTPKSYLFIKELFLI